MIPTRATAERCAELMLQAYATDAPRPMVTRDGDTLYLAFAGSRSARDWEWDAEAWQVPLDVFDRATVHNGFRKAWLACDAAINQGFSDAYDHGLRRFVFTGHSLGAAIALLAAEFWSCKSWSIEVVSFGCPRVGGQAWHRIYRRSAIPTLRIYRDWDPVASAPAWWGWRHVGESLHLTRHGEPIADPTTPWGKLRRLLAWHVGDADHSMSGYQAALAAHSRGGFAWPT